MALLLLFVFHLVTSIVILFCTPEYGQPKSARHGRMKPVLIYPPVSCCCVQFLIDLLSTPRVFLPPITVHPTDDWSDRPKAPPGTFSVVERIMWRACPSPWRVAGGNSDTGGSCAIPKPEQCDHSPVELPSNKGRWKKGKAQGRGARIPAPPKQDAHTVSNVLAGEASDGAPEEVEASQPGEISEQPDEGSGQQDERRSYCDTANSSVGEALDSGGVAEGVDAAVVQAMGFGGFGGSRG